MWNKVVEQMGKVYGQPNPKKKTHTTTRATAILTSPKHTTHSPSALFTKGEEIREVQVPEISRGINEGFLPTSPSRAPPPRPPASHFGANFPFPNPGFYCLAKKSREEDLSGDSKHKGEKIPHKRNEKATPLFHQD